MKIQFIFKYLTDWWAVSPAQLAGDLEELQGKLAASVDSVEKINTELEPIKTKLGDLSVRYNEIYKLQSSRGLCMLLELSLLRQFAINHVEKKPLWAVTQFFCLCF